MSHESLRIDKFLWHIRLFKSRNMAQSAIANGYVRLNGSRVERTNALVRIEDIITMPRGEDVMALRIVSLPMRRGPAPEAEAHYICL
jgi:ribosome-associated heat shock protein Hsp15